MLFLSQFDTDPYILDKDTVSSPFRIKRQYRSIVIRGGPRPPLQSPNHQQIMAQITISPTKNGQNHHHQAVPKITNHQEKNLQITKHFEHQNDRFQHLLLLFLTCTNH